MKDTSVVSSSMFSVLMIFPNVNCINIIDLLKQNYLRFSNNLNFARAF